MPEKSHKLKSQQYFRNKHPNGTEPTCNKRLVSTPVGIRDYNDTDGWRKLKNTTAQS